MGLDFSGSPNAGVYAEQAAQANAAYQQALANVNAKRGQLYNATGFQVTNNPDGSGSGCNAHVQQVTLKYQFHRL